MKSKKIALFLTLFLYFLTSCNKSKDSELILLYTNPATCWEEALPIGNGHVGAMVYGGAHIEQLSLNENTLYSGEPSVIFNDIKITPEKFQQVVNLLKNNQYTEASNTVCKNWLGRLHQHYQPFGDLFITNNIQGRISDYKRELNISEAIAKTTFIQNEVIYSREIYASNPDRVLVVHLKCNKKNAIDVTLNFTSPHPTIRQNIENGRLTLKGKAPGYVERRTFEQIESWGDQYKHPELYDEEGNRKFNKRILYGEEIGNKGMLFEAQLEPIFPTNGLWEASDTCMRIYNTDEVYLIISLATSFNGYDKSPSLEGINSSEKAGSLITKALKIGPEDLRERHIKDYQTLFNRVTFRLKSNEEQLKQPIDQRIIQFEQKPDPNLAALLFQYGRYLMISGSRVGGQPLNLQGLWNKDTIPAWNSGYTMNINAEMNYWPAEITNLSECHEPFFQMVKELSLTGTKTASQMYNRRGWVAHHNTSIWRESLPNDNVPNASFWPMAQGWLCSHLWEHYLFTKDKNFLLKETYPLMKGAAEFYADWLIENENGFLVTPVGISPENPFIINNEESASMSMGPTMDMAIIRETFERTIQASEMLDCDLELRKELKEKLAKLQPYQIGKRGQLQEWIYDFKEVDPQHRHISHLYGFHPGDQITLDKTPDLLKAVEKSLLLRGDAATGWSMGWKINCWARMQDGNHAYKIISNLFNPVGFGNKQHKRGGLYMNMLDAHPPFQIDGNFGYTAGVAEMLLQSHAGYIQLLPALPDVWEQGYISGLKTRGNFEITMRWKENELSEATIHSVAGEPCQIRADIPFAIKEGKKQIAESTLIQLNGKIAYETLFETQKGNSYTLIKRD